MAMNYADVAVRAMQFARSQTPYKSMNKLHTAKGQDFQRMRREVADDKIAIVQGANCDRLDQRVQKIVDEGAGNCGELSKVAYFYLYRVHNTHGRGMVNITAPGDHTFAFVGLDKAHQAKPVAQWGSQCYIIDPWANICCPAPQFPLAWKQKMRKWRTNGKYILDFGASSQAGRYVWIDPTSATWFNQIETCPRQFVYFDA